MRLPVFIRENVMLRDLTTLRIGGPARWFAEPGNIPELRQALIIAREAGIPVRVLGGGSNLLVADSGVDAMVVRLSRRGEFAKLIQDETDLLLWKIGAAVTLPSLLDEAARRGISGVETLAGIPGMIGGAAAMNCGSGGGCIGERIAKAFVCDFSGNELELGADDLDFAYRHSRLTRYVATGFEFRFAAADSPETIAERVSRFRRRKRERQPVQSFSAGCFFKNPPGRSAGALIDAAGCKGMATGGAEVSALHANFLVNRGRATCADVVELAMSVRDRVRERYGVTLMPEVAMWGSADAFAHLREEN